jgi:hypothetical protein
METSRKSFWRNQLSWTHQTVRLYITNHNPNATALSGHSCSIAGTGGCDDTKQWMSLRYRKSDSWSCHSSNTNWDLYYHTIPTATDVCVDWLKATATQVPFLFLTGTFTIARWWWWGIRLVEPNCYYYQSALPTTTSLQSFCIQQNAALIKIAITWSNIKWYDALKFGKLLVNATPLQNGFTY